MNNEISKKGFTLIELLVVVAVISILMLIAILRFMNSTKTSVIRTFESNMKILMLHASDSYIENNGTNQKVYEKVYPKAESMKDKPKYSTYEIDSSTQIITATLKKEAFNGNEDYIITYDVKTSEITQSPYPTLPEGATPLTTQ